MKSTISRTNSRFSLVALAAIVIASFSLGCSNEKAAQAEAKAAQAEKDIAVLTGQLKTANDTIIKLAQRTGELEAKAKAAPVVAAAAKVEKVQDVTAKPAASVAPTAKSVAKTEPDGGWAVQLHVLYLPAQIAIEAKETATAFQKCGEEQGLALVHCVAKDVKPMNAKGTNPKLTSLATISGDLTKAQAVKATACFNRLMPKAVDPASKTPKPNMAEPVQRDFFVEACETAAE